MPVKKKASAEKVIQATKEPELEIHHVGRLLIIDENACEQTFISIDLTKSRIERMFKYQEGLKYMKETMGLGPYSVKAFDYNFTLIEPVAILPSEKDTIFFSSASDKQDWEEMSDGEDETPFEEMTSSVRGDSAMLTIKESGIYYSMHMKHCDIQMESHEITNEELKELYFKLGGSL